MMPRPTTPTVPFLRALRAAILVLPSTLRFAVGDAITGSDGTCKRLSGRAGTGWRHSPAHRFRLSLRHATRLNTETDLMRIGVAGLGRMGAAMAARLIEVGHDVTVWNRSAAKLKPLVDAGAKSAASPAELTGAVEAVITCLTD